MADPGPAADLVGGISSPADEKQAAYEDQRVEELLELGITEAAGSLPVIVSELTNRAPRIRRAALAAAVQFGSRDAVDPLRLAAEQTKDLPEKVKLQEAIDFLQLPSIAEVGNAVE